MSMHNYSIKKLTFQRSIEREVMKEKIIANKKTFLHSESNI